MISFLFRRKYVRVREMAFGSFQDTTVSGSDVVYMHSNESRSFCSNPSTIVKPQYTLVSSLLSDEQTLFSEISKNCRYEIKRAEREGCSYSFYYNGNLEIEDVINDFEQTYNKMFETKGIRLSFNKKMVLEGVRNNNLAISLSRSISYPELKVYHAYLFDNERALLVYSASSLWNVEKSKTSFVGWINKYSHWKDMLEFKKMGLQNLEWGGITSPDTPNGIDKFKMEFGGEVALFMNYIRPMSLIGFIYTTMIRIREGRKR